MESPSIEESLQFHDLFDREMGISQELERFGPTGACRVVDHPKSTSVVQIKLVVKLRRKLVREILNANQD